MIKMTISSLVLLLQLIVLAAPGFATADGSGVIPVDIQPTRYATVSRATVVHEGDRLHISAVLTRPGEVHLPGHVDLVILGEDGAVLERRILPVSGLASNRKGRMDLRFGTVLELDAPSGSRVVLRYHSPGDPEGHC